MVEQGCAGDGSERRVFDDLALERGCICGAIDAALCTEIGAGTGRVTEVWRILERNRPKRPHIKIDAPRTASVSDGMGENFGPIALAGRGTDPASTLASLNDAPPARLPVTQ